MVVGPPARVTSALTDASWMSSDAVALIRARVADELGNLVYAKTARNFNPDMATAADLVIAEVDEIVPVGTLDPEAVVTPHLFVDVLVVRS